MVRWRGAPVERTVSMLGGIWEGFLGGVVEGRVLGCDWGLWVHKKSEATVFLSQWTELWVVAQSVGRNAEHRSRWQRGDG